MKKEYKKSISENLKEYCHLSKDYDMMEVTEWFNGEGFDLYISSSNGDKYINLTFGEFDLLKKLIKNL